VLQKDYLFLIATGMIIILFGIFFIGHLRL